MKAVRTHGRGGPEQLFLEDAPLPEVRRGDVMVRVRSTGITPAELTWMKVFRTPTAPHESPAFRGTRFRVW